MRSAHWLPLVAFCTSACLSACNFGDASGGGSETTVASSGNPPTPPTSNAGGNGNLGNAGNGMGGMTGVHNQVVASTSVNGTVVAMAGASRSVSVAFTSDDGLSITGFAMSGTTYPAGWSGPSDFSCALVGAGNNCVLVLTYSPAAVETGSLTINYIYVDNARTQKAPGGSITIAYAATAHNNVVAQVTPAGQVTAHTGQGVQSVGINFFTDDGNPASALTVTSDLTALPAGWSTSSPGFGCAIVTTGSGCQLNLRYMPTSGARGTLPVAYSFVDGTGATQTASIDIAYATTATGAVVASAAPSGQINAVLNSSGQTVKITFNTDDGKAASKLYVIGGLSNLPSGWSGGSTSFNCASLGTGNGCQLSLKYAPTELTSGTLSLDYLYIDSAGGQREGTVNVAYAATTNDSVVGTASPSGQINAIAPTGSQPVLITFNTDDARFATAFEVTTDLIALPAGWSSASNSLQCLAVNTGANCQLSLTYSPTVADSGSLAIAYRYMNNAGRAKTGMVNIPYRATTNNNVAAAVNPTPVAVTTSTSSAVTVTFNTDDGNPGSNLQVTSNLSALPPGFSSSPSFGCSLVNTGTSCQLSLTYAPTLPDSGTLSLSFSYINNSGTAKSGTADIVYAATGPPPPPPPGP